MEIFDLYRDLVDCECKRMINGKLEVIHCSVEKEAAKACMNKTDEEFEKSLKEE